ncbi:hypothetical protein MAF45_08545 [Mesosutterella sp. OilRF-GAM-744-9]|uniref:Esterase n=1 Tax=Mesosutterella porci TaxID=2915351 RepID=A0ABS9MS77_9BURK|nr:alpha/beta hydrolase-fold protein [Mesosutterella sp. oilRF-744-WT-GAM-9]MCG5031488.1 hypothetical protein [Mesosutterella sp. oilRF-744-WT-GAM-9]
MQVSLRSGGVSVRLWADGPQEAPALVIVNEYEDDDGDLFEACRKAGCRGFVLAVLTDLDWNRDLSPWPEELPDFGGGFGGGAGNYLVRLQDEVLPSLEAALSRPVSGRILAGYSMAGLFALWAATCGAPFSRFVSCSGSLWYPGFAERFASAAPDPAPEAVYLSLGLREPRARSPLMARVGAATEAVYESLRRRGIRSTFEWNPGGHFTDPCGRLARGIAWALEPPSP